MKTLLTVLFLLTFVSCASNSSNKGYVQSAQYQNRAQLRGDYLKSSDKNFTHKQITDLLSKKINLRRASKIAIVRLGNENTFDHNLSAIDKMGQQSQLITEQGATHFKQMTTKSKYIKDVSPIPGFIMPKESTIENLRDVAAMLQADYVLVIRSRSHTRYNFKLFKNNEAKGTTTMEAILMDVRTGVVPFTSIATVSFQDKKNEKTDFSDRDFKNRIAMGAENEAFKELSDDLVNFFN